MSDLHVFEPNPEREENLNVVVQKVNELNSTKNIKLVFITGDLTDTSTNTQWETVKNVLSNLKIPYYPLLGNHDIFDAAPDKSYKENPPTGDFRFKNLFSDKFMSYPSQGIYFSHFTGNNVVNHPTLNYDVYFQNYQINVGSVIFLCLDWVSREDGSSMFVRGAMPYSEMHDFDGGTFKWLESRLNELSSRSDFDTIILIQHHNVKCPFYQPCSVVSFDNDNLNRIESLLKTYNLFDKFYGIFSGHSHKFRDYNIFVDKSEYQTADVKEKEAFSIIEINKESIIVEQTQLMKYTFWVFLKAVFFTSLFVILMLI